MNNKQKYLLAIDEGTTSARAIIFDTHQNIVGIGRKKLTTIYPKEGWVEQDAKEIFSAQMFAISEALENAKLELNDILCIGITNQRETSVLWDKSTGEPVYNAIVWQDRRTADYCQKLKSDGLEELINTKTGLLIDPYFSVTKIVWILENVPESKKLLENDELLFGTIDTWLLWNLTNRLVHATDVTNASRTMMYNIQSFGWDKELLDLFKVPEKILPSVHPNAYSYGHADFNGQQIPIKAMAGDQQAAAFGQACFDVGDVKNTYGTGCFIMMNIGDRFVQSTNRLLTTIAYQVKDQTKYAFEGAIFSAGASIEWLLANKIINEYDELNKIQFGIDDDNEVFFVPAFSGLGAPQWDPYARALIIGLSASSTMLDIIKAALQAMAFQTNDVLKCMCEDTNTTISIMKCDGGVTQNASLMQFQSDISSLTIQLPKITELTALGVAMMAGLETGIYQNLEEIRSLWKSAQTIQPNKKNNTYAIQTQWQNAVIRSKNWVKNS